MAVRPSLRADNKGLEAERGEAAAPGLGTEEAEQQEHPSNEKQKEKKEREVIVIKDDDDPTSSDSDNTGVCDLRFGRRTQPRRYSRATRYHMLLEVALERKRQRQESKALAGSKDAVKAKTSKSAGDGEREKGKKKKQQEKNYCALLFAKDPFDTSSDETDADWDPTAVYGEAARRRLKSRRSETESDLEEDTEGSEEDSPHVADESKSQGEQQTDTQQAHPACSTKKQQHNVSQREGPFLTEEQTRSASSNQEKKGRKPRGSKTNEGHKTHARETKHDRSYSSRSPAASIAGQTCDPTAVPTTLEMITSGRTSTTTSESQEALAEKKEEQQEESGIHHIGKTKKTKLTGGSHEGTTKAR
ncbi:hypothetical protein ACSSS7_004217 [Eimeria intestinalis]